VAIARTHSPAALATLARICSDETAPATAQIMAASILLQRAYGTPVSAAEMAAFSPDDPWYQQRLQAAAERARDVQGRLSNGTELTVYMSEYTTDD
jgi:hypothetical protein